MTRPKEERFSRPLYESLPWLYVCGGLTALVASYTLQRHPMMSVLAGGAGIAAVLWGIVIWLRRRDYRDMRERYKG
jgi:hypothetical protein